MDSCRCAVIYCGETVVVPGTLVDVIAIGACFGSSDFYCGGYCAVASEPGIGEVSAHKLKDSCSE